MIEVAILNQSTVVSDAEVAPVVAALQKQVDGAFGREWGVSAHLRQVNSQGEIGPDDWWLVILDNSDMAGALGYHQLSQTGQPIGFVFAKSDQHYGLNWTVTASHELLEMLVDPNINLTVFEVNQFNSARLYSYEVCDACEADELGYEIDGVMVSDFVYPSWFESFREPGSTKFDEREKINAPFELLKGGYIGVNDITSGIGWWMLTPPDEANTRATPPAGSRRQRRTVAPNRRLRSEPRAAV